MSLCMSGGEIDTSPDICILIEFHFRCELKENTKEILNSIQIFISKHATKSEISSVQGKKVNLSGVIINLQHIIYVSWHLAGFYNFLLHFTAMTCAAPSIPTFFWLQH